MLANPWVRACGPFFPNWLLLQGDAAALAAPETVFKVEIQRAFPAESKYSAVPGNNSEETVIAELRDLKAALAAANVPDEEAKEIIEEHYAERKKIRGYRLPNDPPEPSSGTLRQVAAVLRPHTNEPPRIGAVAPVMTPLLPEEFVDYFRGAVAWHRGQLAAARSIWEILLRRPATERHFKSTWAAYMLGKSWEEENRARAIRYFQLVRKLAAEGFADSLGLAAASLGWEARLQVRDANFVSAIELYLDQGATGDESSINSLAFTITGAFADGPSTRRKLAAIPRCRQAVTAHLLSRLGPARYHTDGVMKEAMLKTLEKASTKVSFVPASVRNWHTYTPALTLWLDAIESARAKDVALAEQLALAAYQAGDLEQSRRWIARAQATPLVDWLQAKLLLRDGKLDTAAAMLAKVCKYFPMDSSATNELDSSGLASRLIVPGYDYFGSVAASHYVRGELGLLQLARHQYVEALDGLLRGGFWADAAYVAEQVLQLGELKNYVDRNWPPPPIPAERQELSEESLPAVLKQPGLGHADGDSGAIRYLLARRLARAKRFAEARQYYPPDCLACFDTYSSALEQASAKVASKAECATAYWRAARICRYVGMELIGTEVSPDWHLHDGQFDYGPELVARIANTNTVYLRPDAAEAERVAQHTPEPDVRFHYRYLAADLAWQAAELMPDNSRNTALVLLEAGCWLRNRDPEAADKFYKAIVLRCPKTDIGAEADRIHWFPQLDAAGKVVPRVIPAKETGNEPESQFQTEPLKR